MMHHPASTAVVPTLKAMVVTSRSPKKVIPAATPPAGRPSRVSEPTAGEGGLCRALPAACEADPCACPLDELAPFCEGQRPNDCLDRFVACEGAYPRQ